ncbi:hypothetical protein FG91_01702 [Sphingopyxis sp. LC81]|uniref:NIPSNAP family protein n=1 Tax=Sphingopyxis sp. LC81 TaxID=1502850 RepID=UPI00050FD65D|nr:NIPSNAP family protein [Sphingopyxis sp. LC81]KGB54802.1 hypothetical protein FG91_01702 [Sphingopyxis sp. LC81]
MPSPIRTLAIAALLVPLVALVALAAAKPAAPVQQLRIYDVPRANEGVFHQRFRDHAMRIMARYGFRIRSIWRSEHEGRTEFVYLLDWPDLSAMDAAWTAFLADPEWIAIKKETSARDGKYVESVAARTLEPVAWSPDRAKAAD